VKALDRTAIREQLMRLRRELGLAGLAAVVTLALTALFYKAALEPMQHRAERLSQQLERQAARAPGQAGDGSASGKLDTLYSYLGRAEGTTDWLAKLHAIGRATGVEMKSANYRSAPPQAGRIERYEIVLPVSGSYVQMRDFLRRALGEIPVLSLDQISLKRESRNDGAVQAELKLTLHMVKQ